MRSGADEEEVTHVVDALTTNFTSFCREQDHFEFLVREALPGLLGAGRKDFAVWSAACATGEEPYSLACYLAHFYPMAAGWDWRILATDISTKALAKAKAGIYAMDRIEQVSTGGKEALKTVLTKLPADMPPIVILQHIPAYFSKAFADRLNGLCQLEVREAVQGDRLRPGLALVAPGGFHMVMQWSGSGYGVRLNQDPPVHYQRPAVDVLFASAVQAGAARYSLSVILTGMGGDGAAGMVRLREGGGRTVAQDEESCVVFGMPREAIRLGGAQEVLSLEKVAARMDRHASEVALREAAAV